MIGLAALAIEPLRDPPVLSSWEVRAIMAQEWPETHRHLLGGGTVFYQDMLDEAMHREARAK